MTWDDWVPRDPSLKPGFDLWRCGDLSGASRFFEQAAAGRPDEPCVWRGLGSVRWTQRRFEDAREAYGRALALDCWNPMNWANLGLVYRDLGLREQAVRAFEAAVALDPHYEPAYNEWANVLFDSGRFQDALPLYRQALALNSRRAVVHHNLGVCLRMMGQTGAAVASFITP